MSDSHFKEPKYFRTLENLFPAEMLTFTSMHSSTKKYRFTDARGISVYILVSVLQRFFFTKANALVVLSIFRS